MRIGELANKTGVSIDSLRFYAKEGLLVYSDEQRYWDFEDDQIILVEHILLLRSLDFSIKDIYYVFHASEELVEGTRVDQEKVADYKYFFEKKMAEILEKKRNITTAERRIEKILSKLRQLEKQEEFKR